MWLYKKTVIKGIEQIPENVFGFIYQSTYTPTNEKYLGKHEKHVEAFKSLRLMY